MGDTDVNNGIKKVCSKRVNESSQQINSHDDSVLVSDDSVAENVLSVESFSMESTGDYPMVPITPRSKCEGVDYVLGLDDSPSPLKLPNQELLDCDYKCKGGDFLEGECDSELLDCDSKCKGGGFSKGECNSSAPFSSPELQLLHCDSQLNDGVFFSDGNPCTPKQAVFDPFAPGPDKVNLAPYHRKYTEEKLSVVRKLKFNLCTRLAPSSEDMIVSEDEILFQSVYSDILEVIILTQTKENGKVSCELPLSDGVRTPIAATRHSGVADVCPGAPVKRRKTSHKYRTINKSVCRKLEF